MKGVAFPEGWRIEPLSKVHDRRGFSSGQSKVDAWFRSSALQSQEKHLSVTKVLLDDSSTIVGLYSLVTSQVDFSELPLEIAKKLPRRLIPVAVLAWFGIDSKQHGTGLGKQLLASALRDCYDASRTFAFVAVILDCVDETAKAFYQQFDFRELPGYPMRLYVSTKLLEEMMAP